MFDSWIAYLILKKWADLVRWRSLKKVTHPHGTIVATNGCFDILHSGHVQMLQEAKKMGDFLVVGINSDWSVKQLKGHKRPINKEADRKLVLEALKCVDFVHIFDDVRATTFLDIAQPHIYVKAADYNLFNMDETEQAVLKKHNSQIKIVPFITGHSTTNIIKHL